MSSEYRLQAAPYFSFRLKTVLQNKFQPENCAVSRLLSSRHNRPYDLRQQIRT